MGELDRLVDDSFPREQLSPDELLACCWDDPGAVIGFSDGSGAASVVTRAGPTGARGFVRLLAVHPGARRQGLGRKLLGACEEWLRSQGAVSSELDAARPFYLWPGIDPQSMIAMLCLLEEAGYEVRGVNLTMTLPVTFRSPTPGDIVIRRVLDDDDVVAVMKLVRVEWADRMAVVESGIEQGTCLAALDEGIGGSRAVGLVCHSVNRAGWLEPVGVAPSCRRRGIGSALVSQTCTDLMVASQRDVVVPEPFPVGFFVRAGGTVEKVFCTAVRALSTSS